jgi:transcriptional regulator with XRE-family HTH domain
MTGDDVKHWRTRRSMTIYQLADVLGVAGATVSRWETGSRHVPAWLARFLDCLERDETTRRPPPENDV